MREDEMTYQAKMSQIKRWRDTEVVAGPGQGRIEVRIRGRAVL